MKKTVHYSLLASLTLGLLFPYASARAADSPSPATASPVKHLVVIFQENRSFDNYFGTYPNAPGFRPLPGTPAAEGIPQGSYNLDENGKQVAPFLFSNEELQTADVNHNFDDMAKAVNGGKMDGFYMASENHAKGTGRIAMGYYDYNALPAYWQYAQHFSMADHFFQPIFGPSTPGALYLVAAQSGNAGNAIKGDPVPAFGPLGGDGGKRWEPLTYANIGDKLSAKGISWSWYQGGYAAADQTYSSHHNPFQYFKNYDTGAYASNLKDYNDFKKDLDNRSLPAVSYVKGAYGDDEHPGLGNQSTPTAEDFSVQTINDLMRTDYWKDTAVIITYDESGGYWDHMAPPQLQPSPDGLAGAGPRIPMILVSPYSKMNFVSHTTYDHTSILKFIEWNWGVDALNSRDASVSNITDMFDFDHPNFAPYVYPLQQIHTNPYGTAAAVQFNNAPLAQTIIGEYAFYDKDKQLMIPVTDLARSLNAVVSYNPDTKTVTLAYNNHSVDLKLNSDQASADGAGVTLEKAVWVSSSSHAYLSQAAVHNLPGVSLTKNAQGVVVIETK
ncbi:stalk domain-containing protein [Paenibacillus filicis]|uniref:Stalk domain-containing protein n=1 Tax=Paenibacillus gyeongsangnamensis TaxID=3388067 RepID=A0ABT4QA99_9BACL|nr:alkaline phosphatase family protein [Paenibacillus filicis]MCZ8513766.1 stalk domain-containing protein [Paenibacillus filicis]